MAHIVDFRAHALKYGSPRHSNRHRVQSAEIVIFPGVRYERWDDGQSGPARKGKKKRDRIDLPD